MNKLMRFLSYVLVALLASFTTIVFLASSPKSSKLDELESKIDHYFVEDVDLTELEDAAAEAMIAATNDRWSYYIPASQYQAYQENNNNTYVGVGISITKSEESAGYLITEVVPDGPAFEAGLCKGDVIVDVDGTDCTGMSLADSSDLIKGEEGTSTVLTVSREGERLSFTVTRRALNSVVTTYELLDSGYGLIRIRNFHARCADETAQAIQQLMNQGAKGLIFDVRFNPGGYKHELVKLLDYILPEGDLFTSELYTGQRETDKSDSSHIEIPMAVLVNSSSYSAAEFFAAALQEYDYAVVVGQQTVGKGFFQQVFELRDGSAASISTGKYYTPKGVSLAGVGITPDYPVEVDDETNASIYYSRIAPEEDPQLQAAVMALQGARDVG